MQVVRAEEKCMMGMIKSRIAFVKGTLWRNCLLGGHFFPLFQSLESHMPMHVIGSAGDSAVFY